MNTKLRERAEIELGKRVFLDPDVVELIAHKLTVEDAMREMKVRGITYLPAVALLEFHLSQITQEPKENERKEQ